jgi:hypothetical protein
LDTARQYRLRTWEPHLKLLHPAIRFLSVIAAFAAGGVAGLFLPVFVAKAIGYGTGSYEDVLFVWGVTVPGGAILASVMVWRRLSPTESYLPDDQQ